MSDATLYDEVDLRLCRIGDHVAHALEGRQDRREALETIEALARNGLGMFGPEERQATEQGSTMGVNGAGAASNCPAPGRTPREEVRRARP